jgi:hypothetical protein
MRIRFAHMFPIGLNFVNLVLVTDKLQNSTYVIGFFANRTPSDQIIVKWPSIGLGISHLYPLSGQKNIKWPQCPEFHHWVPQVIA